MLSTVIKEAGKDFDNANDQKLIADLFISKRFDISLDYYTKIFQAMHMTLDPPLAHCDPNVDIIERIDEDTKSIWYNNQTKSTPAVFHFNGIWRYHLQMEAKAWYKKKITNNEKVMNDLKNRLILVPSSSQPSRRLTFNAICPNIVEQEYGD
jgi:hypothetical protein